MNDKQLLEAAAKVAGIEHPGGDHCVNGPGVWDCKRLAWWKPLTNIADAMNLAAAQLVDVEFTPEAAGAGEFCYVERYEDHGGDRLLAACRAIVRCVVARGAA